MTSNVNFPVPLSSRHNGNSWIGESGYPGLTQYKIDLLKLNLFKKTIVFLLALFIIVKRS